MFCESDSNTLSQHMSEKKALFIVFISFYYSTLWLPPSRRLLSSLPFPPTLFRFLFRRIDFHGGNAIFHSSVCSRLSSRRISELSRCVWHALVGRKQIRLQNILFEFRDICAIRRKIAFEREMRRESGHLSDRPETENYLSSPKAKDACASSMANGSFISAVNKWLRFVTIRNVNPAFLSSFHSHFS